MIVDVPSADIYDEMEARRAFMMRRWTIQQKWYLKTKVVERTH